MNKIEIECKRVEMSAHMTHHTIERKTMLSIRNDAMKLIDSHSLTPHDIIIRLENQPSVILQDENNHSWTFVIRRRGRRYLMAKSGPMTHYEEIYCTSH
jgi:hypothetical protein